MGMHSTVLFEDLRVHSGDRKQLCSSKDTSLKGTRRKVELRRTFWQQKDIAILRSYHLLSSSNILLKIRGLESALQTQRMLKIAGREKPWTICKDSYKLRKRSRLSNNVYDTTLILLPKEHTGPGKEPTWAVNSGYLWKMGVGTILTFFFIGIFPHCNKKMGYFCIDKILCSYSF